MALLSPPTETTDRTLLGIVIVLVSMVIFSGLDGIGKVLAAHYHPFEINFVRSVFSIGALAPFIARRTSSLRSAMPLLQIGRGLCMTGSIILFLLGLPHMPIADATAINFFSPLLVTALSVPLLGETVGIHRWSAVLIGFLGVLIVARPGTATFNPAAIYPLLSAVVWALGLMLTRRMRGGNSVLTTILYTTLVGLVASAVTLPSVWRMPDLPALLLMAVMGVGAAIAQTMLIAAVVLAPASLVAPFSYSQMLWSTLIGLFVFGTVPDALTWIGATIIVASGLYIFHRERLMARRRPRG